VEVGVPLGALGGSFTVDQNRTKAVGQGANVVLSIGDKVKVEITGVDEDLRRVSAWVVEASAQDGKGKTRSFVPSLAAPATLREADFVPDRAGSRARPRAGAERPARPKAGADRPARPGGRAKPERTGRPPERAKPAKGSVRGGRPKTSAVSGFGKPQAKRKKV
jgi:ribonuclease R